MFKRIVGLILCTMMLTPYVYSKDAAIVDTEEIQEDVQEDFNVYTLSLEEAISMAKSDNPQLNASIAKKEDNNVQLKSAKETKSQYRDLNEFPGSTMDIIYVKNGYYVHTYENAVKLSDYEYKQIEAQIAYNVTEKYFNLKNCEKLVEIAQNSYNLIQDNYNNTKLSYELGLISKTELDSANVSLLQAQFVLESYKDSYDIAKEDFKIALRKNDENCDFVLTGELVVEDFTTNLSEDLIKAENSRYDIISLKTNRELAKEYYDITWSASTARKSAALSNYITADYNYTNNKSLILLGIKSSYNNISSSRNNVILTEETFKLKKNNYEIAKVKYEQGMITNAELLNILNDVYTAEVEFENAKLKYVLAVDKYKYDIEIGI